MNKLLCYSKVGCLFEAFTISIGLAVNWLAKYLLHYMTSCPALQLLVENWREQTGPNHIYCELLVYTGIYVAVTIDRL